MNEFLDKEPVTPKPIENLAAPSVQAWEQSPGLPDPELSEFTKDGNPLQIELRGYEVAKMTRLGTWEVVSKFRPNEAGKAQAIADATWLQERWPNSFYDVRAIVSLKPPVPKVDLPLHLTQDEEPNAAP